MLPSCLHAVLNDCRIQFFQVLEANFLYWVKSCSNLRDCSKVQYLLCILLLYLGVNCAAKMYSKNLWKASIFSLNKMGKREKGEQPTKKITQKTKYQKIT